MFTVLVFWWLFKTGGQSGWLAKVSGQDVIWHEILPASCRWISFFEENRLSKSPGHWAFWSGTRRWHHHRGAGRKGCGWN
ncbi:hypothetical protein BKA66DRAFT_479773 [Pyrenochaeta sp. MPI-SDFR-AT-0127]|nr:hypothetical protein BKA66DRAFT_479773 [Pyrenochaeta sp. MPI-SDFR-AT-0127]